jgi:ribosome-associated protein
MEITSQISIPEEELSWSFVRSSGPGGQNVNKVASKAVVRWNLLTTEALPPDALERLMTQQQNRINRHGELILSSQEYRDQPKNIEAARARLRAIVLEALEKPTIRRPTKPSRGAKARRLLNKRQTSEKKQSRRASFD